MRMTGWKTWLGAAIIGLGAALQAVGLDGFSEPIRMLGVAVMGVGIGHKVEKATKKT